MLVTLNTENTEPIRIVTVGLMDGGGGGGQAAVDRDQVNSGFNFLRQ